MDLLAERIKNLSESKTLSISATAKQLYDEGVDVCSLIAGEPDKETPEFIKQAAIQALEEGKTHYTPAAGIMPLREAIADKFLLDNNIEAEPTQVVVSCGAKHSLFNAVCAICDPGDEVMIPAPYWTSYPEMVRAAGAEPNIIKTKFENGWKLTAEEFDDAMTAKTKMLILNSPNNPTGAVYNEEELRAIGEVAAAEDIVILSDELYEKLIYNEREHISIASLSKELAELTITVNGFSKAYAMTGWRLGYLTAPAAISKAITTIQSHTTSNATSFAQYGGLAALKADQAFVGDMRDEFDMRRQYMLNRLQKIKNVRVLEPEGAFYFLVDTTPMEIKSVNLTEKLLRRFQVAAIPGIAFGHDHSVRFSYATGLDVIKKGLDRFEEFCLAH